ncbi:MAG: hypothetical protein MZV64_28205 [Ignavibacteriales bacterium]|nr:hypothetical protein [Ignavibacteriales bacterium]
MSPVRVAVDAETRLIAWVSHDQTGARRARDGEGEFRRLPGGEGHPDPVHGRGPAGQRRHVRAHHHGRPDQRGVPARVLPEGPVGGRAMPSVMISCGEPSGDLYAGALARELRRLSPGTQIVGLGGEHLRERRRRDWSATTAA